MKPFYPTMRKSCRKFYSKFKSVIMIIVIDIIFFICLAGLFTKVWEKAMVHITAVTDLMDINLAQLGEVQTEAQLSALAANQAMFMAHYRQISYYIGMLLVGILALWIVFQSVSWFITNNAIGKKKSKFIPYFGKFALLTAAWWVLFVLLLGFGTRLSAYSTMAALPYISNAASKSLFFVLLFFIFYLAYTSYALIPSHKMKRLPKILLRAAYHEWKTLLPAYLFTAAILVGEYFFFMRSFALGGYAAALFAVVIIFPTVAWSRFYAMTAVD